MRRINIITITISLFLFFTGCVLAVESGVSVTIDGVKVEFTQESGSPFIDENNRTQTPFRQTLEAFGATVDWEPVTRTAVAEKNGITVRVPIGTNYIYKNDLMIVNDTTSMIVNERTYLPVRIVLEAFGADVSWDSANRDITVSSDGETISIAILAAQVEAAMAEIHSMEAELTTAMSGRIEDETEEEVSTLRVSLFFDPIMMKMTQTAVDYTGTTIYIDAYGFQEGDAIVWITYDNFEGRYVRFSTSDITYTVVNPFVAFAIRSLDVIELATTEDSSIVKLGGAISVETLDKIATGSGSIGQMWGAADNVIDEDIIMTMWVDMESKTIMRYEIDMSDYLSAAARYDSMFAQMGMVIYAVTMEVTISNINNATEFVIPEELSN